jgi:excinuclease UvrABC nuclease subunit
VYVTRRLRKDGSAYFGPYFPANLAYRIVDLIHRNFLIPSCKVDLTRLHARPCLQYYIRRCLGPCVKDLTTPEMYQEAVRDVKMFLEGRPTDLAKSLRTRMEHAAGQQEYERAARYRDLISTVEQLQERQRMAAAEGDDADVFGYHYENGMLAVNLFHMRGGKMVDRREFFWEDLPEFAVATEHVGTAAIGYSGEQGSPFAASVDQRDENPSRASLGMDGPMGPSLHEPADRPRTCRNVNLFGDGDSRDNRKGAPWRTRPSNSLYTFSVANWTGQTGKVRRLYICRLSLNLALIV